MAIDHFNARDVSVVPELANATRNCSINFGNVSVLDTGTNDKHIAMQDLASVPDAIAGTLLAREWLDLVLARAALLCRLCALTFDLLLCGCLPNTYY